jgi:hypothetical protein
MKPPDMATVAAMLAERIATLAVELVGAEPTERTRTEWRFRSRGSLAVAIAGPKRGSFYDFEGGEGGDALALVAHLRGTSMKDAHDWALSWLGIADGDEQPPPRPRPVAPPQAPRGHDSYDTLPLARDLWREGRPAAGSLVEDYLRSRGLTLPDDRTVLRFHPRAWRNRKCGPPGPAMLALMSDPLTGEPCGLHVTYLRADGAGKAEGERQKIMLGRAGVIRLTPDEDVTSGLGIGEGIETALSVAQVFDWRPMWAATSAGGIRTFPVLSGIEALTLFADMDDRGVGIAAAQACVERWTAAGREACIVAAPRDQDFNDVTMKGAAR